MKLTPEERDKIILMLGFLTIHRNNQMDADKRRDFDDIVLKPLQDLSKYKIPKGMLKNAK